MTKHNPENERIKRKYFAYLKEAKRYSEPTVDAAAKALSRFEQYNRYRDFKAFHFEQAVAFKGRLAEQNGQRSGEKLSKATLHATLTQLKQFFFWLAGQPGYKARLQYSDANYFNLSEKDTRVATAQRERKAPTLEQVKHVIETMPGGSEIERRNRALLAFTLLTGARDSAIASMKLKHVDLQEGCVYQDAREVKTKFSKTFTTYFFPVGDGVQEIVVAWVGFFVKRSCGAMTIRCFRQRGLRLAQVSSLKLVDLTESIGARQRQSGPSSAKPSREPDCLISIRTAFGRRWRDWASRSARLPKISRRGARIWGMSRF